MAHIEGNIAIVAAQDDAVIPESQSHEQINAALANKKKDQVIKFMVSQVEHASLWVNERITSQQFDQFLQQINFSKRIFS